MLFSCLGAIATLLLPASVTADDHECGRYHACMKHAEPESSLPVVQLLRHALSLDLSVTYAPDGQATISQGTPPAVALREPCTASQDFEADDANEDPGLEDGLQRIEYWAKWTVADDYPAPGDQNWRYWAWEFLRRNEQYALLATWMNGLPEGVRRREEPQADDLLAHVLCDPAPLAGQRTVGEYTETCQANGIRGVVVMPIHVLRHCWGVTWPLSPLADFLDLSLQEQACFFASETPATVAPAYLLQDTWLPDFPFQAVRSVLSNKEILLKFDLSESLDGQFQRASTHLRDLRRAYFMKSRMNAIAPDDLDSMDSDDDLGFISDSKTYPKARQLQLRIFDAANINGGFLTKNLCQTLAETFKEEMDGKNGSADQPKTITAQKVKEWYSDAKNIVNGGYRALARYKPLTEVQRQSMRGRKKSIAQ